MAYESQMINLAEGAINLHGELEEVLFLKNNNKDSVLVFSDGAVLPVEHRMHGYDIRREAYAFRVAAQLGGTDPFSLLTFGYSGTGPQCYAAFLDAAGFLDTNAVDIDAPLKLKADGTRINGVKRQAKWTQEITGKSIDDARQKIEQPKFPDACILFEEVVSDGAIATKTVTVDTASQEEAERTAKKQILDSSEILDIRTVDKQTLHVEKIEALDETEASAKAKERIKSTESAYKSPAGVTCFQEAHKGFLGIGKKPGMWEARYNLAQKEVTIRFRPPATIRIHFGSRKLKCNQCGNVMTTTTDGISYAGAGPSVESAVLKLRCEKCDITRIEKKWEIEGEWIAWDDGGYTIL
jgi:hypothetical protein